MTIPLDAYRAGSTEPWTAALIGAIVTAKKPHVLLETGTFEARTTRVIFEAMLTYADEHGALLTTVECDATRAQAARALIATWSGPQHGLGIEVICGAAERYISAGIQDGTLDFAFLDDDHTAGHVYEELVALLPKMRPGGIILMHDVVGPFGLGEICKRFGGIVLELPRMHTAGGLGVITC